MNGSVKILKAIVNYKKVTTLQTFAIPQRLHLQNECTTSEITEDTSQLKVSNNQGLVHPNPFKVVGNKQDT